MTFRANTLRQVSPSHHPTMGRLRKRRSDHSRQLHSVVLLPAVRYSQDRICFKKFPTAIILASSRLSHHIHDRSAVLDNVSQ